MKRIILCLVMLLLTVSCDITRSKQIKETKNFYLATTIADNVNIVHADPANQDYYILVTSYGAGWTIHTAYSNSQFIVAIITDQKTEIVQGYVIIEIFPACGNTDESWSIEDYYNKNAFEEALRRKKIMLSDMSITKW
ncbi:MAG: hypothetical protein IKP93_00140 [Paludibacteraceae bacterium]|nr:hypothetical protein [Paludibacteraceae bacterium]